MPNVSMTTFKKSGCNLYSLVLLNHTSHPVQRQACKSTATPRHTLIESSETNNQTKGGRRLLLLFSYFLVIVLPNPS